MLKDQNRNIALHETVYLSLDEVGLSGELSIPERAETLVLFVSATASGASSVHRSMLVEELNRFDIASLSLDLLTEDEENSGKNWSFDIEFLTRRIVEAYRWLREYPETKMLKLGLLGTGTGAAAILVAASELPKQIRAVVAFNGRPDLAGLSLQKIQSPTLFIVGNCDRESVELHRRAAEHMRCEHHTEKVPGASHTFMEEGTFERAAELSRQWFDWYLTR